MRSKPARPQPAPTGRAVDRRVAGCSILARGALVALALACAGRGAASPALPPTPPEADVSTPPFVDGAALDPASALLSWLQQAGSRRVQLPVVLTCSPLGVTDAYVGTHAGPAPEGALLLKLDEGALGIGLATQLSTRCGDGPCAFWLEGTWGPHLTGGPSLPGPGMPSLPGGPAIGGPERHPFTVRAVVGPVDGAPTHARVAP
jgi:hypothetical protein